MTRTFTSKDKLYTFTVTECTALRTVDFDFSNGREIVERQPALLVEWENTRGVKFNAIAFSEMPANYEEFDMLWCDPLTWITDAETICTVEVT